MFRCRFCAKIGFTLQVYIKIKFSLQVLLKNWVFAAGFAEKTVFSLQVLLKKCVFAAGFGPKMRFYVCFFTFLGVRQLKGSPTGFAKTRAGRLPGSNFGYFPGRRAKIKFLAPRQEIRQNSSQEASRSHFWQILWGTPLVGSGRQLKGSPTGFARNGPGRPPGSHFGLFPGWGQKKRVLLQVLLKSWVFAAGFARKVGFRCSFFSQNVFLPVFLHVFGGRRG